MKTSKFLSFLLVLVGVFVAAVAIDAIFVSDAVSALSTGGTSLAIVFTGITMPNSSGYADGTENMGGYGIKAYLALYDDIATWPTEPSNPTSLDEAVLLSGNFAMVSNKYFIEVLVSPDSLEFNPEGQGEPGGRSFKPKGSFFLPSLSPTNRGLARWLNNSRGVLIIPDDTGEFRMCIGTENRPAFFKPSGSSGKKAADAKGFTYEYDCDSFAPGYTYNGSIPLSGSTIDPIGS